MGISKYNHEGYYDPVPCEALSSINKEAHPWRPLVYICSAYSGNIQANTEKAKRYRNYKNIVNTMNAAKPMLAIDVSELDYDAELLNTPDGTYDLEKGIDGIMLPVHRIRKNTTGAMMNSPTAMKS